jgi:hypothetical protein
MIMLVRPWLCPPWCPSILMPGLCWILVALLSREPTSRPKCETSVAFSTPVPCSTRQLQSNIKATIETWVSDGSNLHGFTPSLATTQICSITGCSHLIDGSVSFQWPSHHFHYQVVLLSQVAGGVPKPLVPLIGEVVSVARGKIAYV